jgi:uncharacterized protein (DUF302 family)
MNESTHPSLGLTTRLALDFDAALARVVAALKDEGFGILTRIDVHATLQEKLGVSFRPYTILGACNPPLAHRALTTAPEVGLLLPCNVVVEQVDAGACQVAIADPTHLLTVVGRPELAPIAAEARSRLERVIAALAAPA